jgi:hypothetical protein
MPRERDKVRTELDKLGVNLEIILRDFLADILRVWDPCENGPTV